LEKSLIISKQECAQWREKVAQLEKENQALAEISPNVIQYRIHTLKCVRCGKKVRVQLPKKAKHSFGPHSAGFFSSTISGRPYQQKKAQRFGKRFWDQSVSGIDLQYSQKSG